MLQKMKKLKSKFKKIELYWLLMGLIFTIVISVLQGTYGLFILNYLIFLSITSLAFLFKKPKTPYFLLSGVMMILAITSAILLKFRGTPLTAGDMYSIQDGFTIAKKYLGENAILIIGVIFLIALVGLVFLYRKEKKLEDFSYKRSIFVIILPVIIVTCILYKVDLSTGMIKTYNWDLAATYRHNGFLVSYYKSITELKPKKPEVYNKDSIAKIKDSMDNSSVAVNSKVGQEEPNIIVVQLESFMDPARLTGITFKEDPIPNIRKIVSEGPHGMMAAPTFGAGTVRTEFEVLTGYSASNLGAGEIPNNTILKKQPVESLATILKDKGYDVTAIHDYLGNFYDRDTVYSNFGFDKFVSMEYIKDVDYNGNSEYPSDMNNMKPIEEILKDQKKPQFIFNVAVESHGPYSEKVAPENGKYTFDGNGLTTEEKNQLQSYVNKLSEVDKYVASLVNYVNESKRPTVIAFYSDHLPMIKVLDKPDCFDGNKKYTSEYFIWSNMGIKPVEKDISAYQLSTYVLSLAGINSGVMPNFHRANAGADTYAQDFKNLQYDQLNGENYLGAEKPKKAENMTLGLNPIKITNAYMYDGNLIIDGENFTKASKIVIDNKEVPTEYESSNKLIAYKVNSASKIKVSQVGMNKKVLSSTAVYEMK